MYIRHKGSQKKIIRKILEKVRRSLAISKIMITFVVSINNNSLKIQNYGNNSK